MLELPVTQHRPPPVTTLMVYLTEDCNLRCTYCFVKKTPRRMSSETVQKTVKWFLDPAVSGYEPQLYLNFFGGEPFMALDQMEEMVALCRRHRSRVRRRIQFCATTNGTVATERVQRLLERTRMKLLISLDGAEEANAYRPFVSGRPSYKVVARNLPKLLAWCPDALVRMTFHPGALDFVANLKRVWDLGAPNVALCPVVEADWEPHRERLEEAYGELVEFFIKKVINGERPGLITTWNMLAAIQRARAGVPRPARPCEIGSELLGVDPDGNVMPCHRFLYRPHQWLGTVESSELPSERKQYTTLTSKDILGCHDCIANKVCGGGCRVVVLQIAGDLRSGRHPGYCLTTQAHFRAATIIYDRLSEQAPEALQRGLSLPSMSPDIQELIA